MVEKRSRRDKIDAKVRSIKAKIRQEILMPEKIILATIPILLITWLIGSISSLSRNWKLQQEINAKKNELALLSLEVDNLALENNYYSSEEYQELAARKLQNKKLSGETLITLPKNLKKSDKNIATKTSISEKNNIDKWLTFLFNL